VAVACSALFCSPFVECLKCRVHLGLVTTARIKRAKSDDEWKALDVGTLWVIKWVLAVGACHTPANLETGSRTVVSPPVRMVQSNKERRGLALIPLVTRYDIAENAYDLARFFHNARDP
jgi:hypothetical protein